MPVLRILLPAARLERRYGAEHPRQLVCEEERQPAHLSDRPERLEGTEDRNSPRAVRHTGTVHAGPSERLRPEMEPSGDRKPGDSQAHQGKCARELVSMSRRLFSSSLFAFLAQSFVLSRARQLGLTRALQTDREQRGESLGRFAKYRCERCNETPLGVPRQHKLDRMG
jgi:hypothetical protein